MRVIKLIFAVSVSFAVLTGCVSSYHVHVFSDDVETMVSRIETKTNAHGDIWGGEIVYEGIFSASNYEDAMIMAKRAGYTKVLSIEYGTKTYLGFIGEKYVTIRCAKDTGTAGVLNEK